MEDRTRRLDWDLNIFPTSMTLLTMDFYRPYDHLWCVGRRVQYLLKLNFSQSAGLIPLLVPVPVQDPSSVRTWARGTSAPTKFLNYFLSKLAFKLPRCYATTPQ